MQYIIHISSRKAEYLEVGLTFLCQGPQGELSHYTLVIKTWLDVTTFKP
jgi:hypothetical protein